MTVRGIKTWLSSAIWKSKVLVPKSACFIDLSRLVGWVRLAELVAYCADDFLNSCRIDRVLACVD